MTKSRIALEVCVDNAAGLAAAIAGGADRIELCSALPLGGLTPSPGFMAFAAKCSVPVYAMIRPRIGDFIFSEAEVDMMRRDIDVVRAAGLAGVVLGANSRSGALDEAALRILSTHAAGLGTTLHRAIDLAPSLLHGVDLGIDLKFERILSSGGRRTAPEGIDILVAMNDHARGRISIMPGSGVNAGSINALLSRLAVREVHGSCSADVIERDSKVIEFGFANARSRQTSLAEVSALRYALDQNIPVTTSASTI